jgi:predicted lipoprotein with Yx(FWY)xxD motif
MIRAAVVTLCSGVLVVGCGGSTNNSSVSTSTAQATGSPLAKAVTTAPPAAANGTTLKLVSSQYGQILADGSGQAFYLFGKEHSSRSQCYGACAHKWPPVLVKGNPRAGPGGQGRLLGTARRRDGKLQLTYAGHAMYYYEGDSPGRVLCQGVNEFGGPWLVVQPNGKPVR